MSAIFCHDKDQQKMAEQSLKEAQQSCNKPITTMILPAAKYYLAEE